ncbi:NADH-quinone oxidoreductase subunit NuoK [Lapillicoccus jejuensis]|uniref:NADH-quinone oxidoreductase subunit K n=1 Tax=Lapillicoccus jejuensis TaxID=402171 RepID=A0A542DWZ4_9MICO|nr:NADH-quinone oxidoreductase subunit K [Lapillicoccus jejuensis]TQJ07607.1 NADH dehydrogenase subunit K [Lapillicoccus jejuensis]
MHLWLPVALAAVLAGTGLYGVLARRNAVLVLVGVELVLASATLLLVTLGARGSTGASGATALPALQTGQVLTLFVITLAAAEICVALAVVLALFRLQGHVDVSEEPRTEDTAARTRAGSGA